MYKLNVNKIFFQSLDYGIHVKNIFFQVEAKFYLDNRMLEVHAKI